MEEFYCNQCVHICFKGNVDQVPLCDNEKSVNYKTRVKNIHDCICIDLCDPEDVENNVPDHHKIDIKGILIDAYDLSYAKQLSSALGDALKYILRTKYTKSNARIKDLEKAINAIKREIKWLKNKI